MKIVEKKCPNCGAPLDFRVGEVDITCSHCRKKFAVKYNGEDFAKLGKEAIDKIRNAKIDLQPLMPKNLLLIVLIPFILILLTFIFAVVFQIVTFTSILNRF